MTPDYTRAAILAAETLIKYNIKNAPVDPIPVYKNTPGVLLLPFADASQLAGADRKDLTEAVHDAVTVAYPDDKRIRYLVSYNQRLSVDIIQRTLARELGHIMLQHDGSRPEDVRMDEAYTFALHFLFPRPLIYAVQQSGFPLTAEALGSMTGCDARCLQRMKRIPGVHVPPELNRLVRDQFADYINNFIEYEAYLCETDRTLPADVGSYMDGYEE